LRATRTRQSTKWIVDVFGISLSAVRKRKGNFLINSVDEEVKKLLSVDITVCLLVGVQIFSKQAF